MMEPGGMFSILTTMKTFVTYSESYPVVLVCIEFLEVPLGPDDEHKLRRVLGVVIMEAVFDCLQLAAIRLENKVQ